MEKFKIEIFESENNKSFPELRKASTSECNFFKKKIIEILDLKGNEADTITILKVLEKRSVLIPDNNADHDDFNFLSMLSALHLSTPEYVNVNWYRFDDIEVFKLADFSDNLKYIWYPGPDEIEVFPNDLSWVISIDAMGSIYILR